MDECVYALSMWQKLNIRIMHTVQKKNYAHLHKFQNNASEKKKKKTESMIVDCAS